MKLLGLFLTMLVVQSSFGQIKVTQLNIKTIPKTIHYPGHVINAVHYIDKEGEHMVITTETGETPSKGSENGDDRDAALYAYHYNISNNTEPKLSWQTYDFIKECPVDIKANYVPNTFAITDLDNNGKAEVWLMYKTVCHGDVSQSYMKIIMHEGNKKYAIRGENKVRLSEKEYVGGEYTFDEAFKKGPELFRQYAIGLWKKNLLETWK